EVETRLVSDHCLVILDTSPPSWGPAPFRFENAWVEHKFSKKDFEKWWKEISVQGCEGYKWMARLKQIRICLKKWNTEVFGDLRLLESALLKKVSALDVLEGSEDWNEQTREERVLLKSELHEILFKKDRAARQKVKIQWAKEGDAKTKLFHRMLNAQKSRNFISKIELENGEILNREEDIVREKWWGFCESLYSKGERQFIGIEGLEWAEISDSMSTWLEGPFLEAKIKAAVFECEGEKASGPDGFSLLVFQSMLETIKDDLVNVFEKFHRSGVIR
ncbi:hypothetical protein PanWU01x14_217610, partial [Parasponia andersonii]